MKKNIIITIAIILILWIIGWTFAFKDKIFKKSAKNIKKTSEVETVLDSKAATEQILLKKEIQERINKFQEILKPNYLKVTNYQESDDFFWYKDPNVKWFYMPIDYDITPSSMANYDVIINKGSITEADFKRKSKLYKENIARKMKNIYYPTYGYDKFKKTWIFWYIAKDEDGIYTLYTLWDYVDNTFNNNIKDVELWAKLQILIDFLNYKPVFFKNDRRQIKELADEVVEKMNNKDFSSFMKGVNKVYFLGIKKKK